MLSSPAGWIIVMHFSLTVPKRPWDSCSSYRTLLSGFWAEPENMNISHQSSGLYTCSHVTFRNNFKVLLLLQPINHSMA